MGELRRLIGKGVGNDAFARVIGDFLWPRGQTEQKTRLPKLWVGCLGGGVVRKGVCFWSCLCHEVDLDFDRCWIIHLRHWAPYQHRLKEVYPSIKSFQAAGLLIMTCHTKYPNQFDFFKSWTSWRISPNLFDKQRPLASDRWMINWSWPNFLWLQMLSWATGYRIVNFKVILDGGCCSHQPKQKNAIWGICSTVMDGIGLGWVSLGGMRYRGPNMGC